MSPSLMIGSWMNSFISGSISSRIWILFSWFSSYFSATILMAKMHKHDSFETSTLNLLDSITILRKSDCPRFLLLFGNELMLSGSTVLSIIFIIVLLSLFHLLPKLRTKNKILLLKFIRMSTFFNCSPATSSQRARQGNWAEMSQGDLQNRIAQNLDGRILIQISKVQVKQGINYNQNKMRTRLLIRSFSFLKNLSQRQRVTTTTTPYTSYEDSSSYEPYKDSTKAIVSQQGAIPIDLTKLKLDYLPDTEELKTNVPRLEHGLESFLTGELVFGDHGVGNLPQQQDIHPNTKISQISNYVEPSKDPILQQKGLKDRCKYISSTSSISTPLVALFYLFTNFRLPNCDYIFQDRPHMSKGWMSSTRKPTSFYLHKISDDCDSIVADKGVMPVQNQVLMDLGHIVQYFLTHTRQETDHLLKGEKVPDTKNYYRYVRVNEEIMLRSQIDCMSYDKQGNPFVFEIKSRACAPIRYDITNYKDYKDYQINLKRGEFESFEREYYDLIRGGFLKYVMQVKIGRMDGAFIAYHNTEKIYGYEYVELKQMARRVFGDQYNLDLAFICISKMLTIVLNHVRKSLPEHKNDSLKIGFYSEFAYKKLVVMVEGMSKVKQYVPLKEKTEQVQNTVDYFKKYRKLENPIYKFEFDFFIDVNGKRLSNPEVLLTPHDTLEIKYKASQKLFISQQQYLVFLNEAYKEKDIYGSTFFKGFWVSNQDEKTK